MAIAPLCRRSDPEVSGCLRQSEEALRGAYGRRLPYRDRRFTPTTAIGEGRSNSGDSHIGTETPRAGAENHRRSFQYCAGAGGIGSEAEIKRFHTGIMPEHWKLYGQENNKESQRRVC